MLCFVRRGLCVVWLTVDVDCVELPELQQYNNTDLTDHLRGVQREEQPLTKLHIMGIAGVVRSSDVHTYTHAHTHTHARTHTHTRLCA
jgi:hypothetical protein